MALPRDRERSRPAAAARPGLAVAFRNLARLGESPIAMVGTGIVLFWALCALFAPWISPYEPNAQDLSALADPTPSTSHPLGTDLLGRDMLARLLYGARLALTLAPAAVLVAYVAGCAMGLAAGYFGGWADSLISRCSDVVLSFPVLILYVILITAIGPSALNIIFAVTVASSPGIGRIVRGLTLSVRNLDYVSAAEIRGERPLYVMIAEILPSARGPLVVDFCLRIGYTIITIGILGFLGLGLPPPDPDWGGMVRDATALITIWPHMSVLPSVAIVSLAIGFNLLADGLRTIAGRD